MMKKQIINTMEQHHLIERGAHIVIGLSGGPDSVCLFDVFCQMAEEQNWTLYPVHVNHKFRPGAAEMDQAVVEKLCKERGWPCRSFIYDCAEMAKEEKLTPEEAGRKARYTAFANVAEEVRTSGVPGEDIVIAVAQNADDQAETILFRMMRGSGTDGLAGIPYSRRDEQGNRIVRPLLDCWKKDILDYCAERNLHPCIDHTNEEAVYTRNKIRLELIPYLEQEYNPNIKDTMIRMGKACMSDRDYLRQTAEDAFNRLVRTRTDNDILFDGDGLRKLHRSIRQRVLAMAFDELGLDGNLSYRHYESCEDILFHEHPSARTDLPKGYSLVKNYENIKVCKPTEGDEEKRLHIGRMTVEEYNRLNLKRGSHAVFDADEMERVYGMGFEQNLRLACREAGDTLTIGNGKRKKLQDYFVDRKIPKDERDKVKVVKIGHDVLWVTPYNGRGRFCSDFKLCSDTKNVICIEIICVL